MATQREAFIREWRELCEKYRLVAVPTYDGQPSAHDPMVVVELDDFWRDFLERRVYDPNNAGSDGDD